MKRSLMLFLCLLQLASAALTAAQGNRLTLNWWTVDGGGGVSGHGPYSLHTTVGQPDAGQMGVGQYTLHSGYWDGPGEHNLYLTLVTRP